MRWRQVTVLLRESRTSHEGHLDSPATHGIMMGFMQPMMKTTHGQPLSPKGVSPRKPDEQHISNRPEVIGAFPLWLATRATEALASIPRKTISQSTRPKDKATTLREIAHYVEASDEELSALRAQVMQLQRALDARVGGSTENATSIASIRIFTELCRVQTKFTRAERQLAEVRDVVNVLRKQCDGFHGDFVMVSVAFIGMVVAFLGYIIEGRNVFTGFIGGV